MKIKNRFISKTLFKKLIKEALHCSWLGRLG